MSDLLESLRTLMATPTAAVRSIGPGGVAVIVGALALGYAAARGKIQLWMLVPVIAAIGLYAALVWARAQ